MCKFVDLQRFSAATAATVATKFKKLVATLFPQGSNTGSNTHDTLYSLLSRLKMPFNSRVGSNGSNTFPNFAQEIEPLREGSGFSPSDQESPNSWEFGDEFDHEDYDEWYDEESQYEDDYYHDYGDGLGTYDRGTSWEQRAVDEAIEDEKDDSIGDIPW